MWAEGFRLCGFGLNALAVGAWDFVFMIYDPCPILHNPEIPECCNNRVEFLVINDVEYLPYFI